MNHQRPVHYSRLDDSYDATIELTCNTRNDTWASRLSMRGKRAVQFTGRIRGGGATKHSLLAVGLIATLRQISRKTVDDLLLHRNAQLKVKIATIDESFPQAIEAIRTNRAHAEGSKRLRANRNLAQTLLWQLRFHGNLSYDFVAEAGSASLLTLSNWSSKSIFNEKFIGNIPPVFQPDAASILAPLS